MLGLNRTTITGLVAAGFVTPARGPRNALRFSFQDLMLLRTAFALQEASIPPRKILRSLAKLKAELPSELPLTGLRITAVGSDVVVRDRAGHWQAETGQLVMDFEVASSGGTVAFLQPSERSLKTDWFRRGVELERTDPVAAEDAFRRAIAADPSAEEPYLNLGAMLCESGRCGEAVALYESAREHHREKPLMHFNYAVALEDQDRLQEADATYRRAIALDPAMADAHYNLGMLLEKAGDAQGAFRHFSAYRRLQRDEAP